MASVAEPGKSRHSTGYAVDIYDDNNKKISISKLLGASLVFPECSHVHVEYAKGVADKPLPVGSSAGVVTLDVESAQYGEDSCLATPLELAELKNSTRNAQVTGDYSDRVSYLEVVRDLFADFVSEKWWRG